MAELTDHELLAQYARENSEAAFSALVTRHVNLVYSAAWRSTGNAQAAEEIAQAVFIILAKKAGALPRKVVLSGWLYHTARLTAANYLRAESRRQKREQEAYMQSSFAEETEAAWQHIAPLLEEAMAKLADRDRDALVLRFFENKSLREVGLALGTSEDAAKLRVNRALEKLRQRFSRRGVVFSTAAIAGAVSTHSVQAAPAILAKTIAATALTHGAAAGGSTLTLVKGALKFMAWTKMKTAIITTAVVLLSAGATTVTVTAWREHSGYQWQGNGNYLDADILEKAPPMVKIVPSKKPITDSWTVRPDGKMYGLGVTPPEILRAAWGMPPPETVILAPLPKRSYDFISSLSRGAGDALVQKFQQTFGVVCRYEKIATNVYVLVHPAQLDLRLNPTRNAPSSIFMRADSIAFTNNSVPVLALMLEASINVPVLDRTGLDTKPNYDFTLNWGNYIKPIDSHSKYPYIEALRAALRDQLGLDLVLTNMPIQMLVVSKAH